MNLVFVGGGSLRILPIIRAVWKNPEVLNGGSIRLVDRVVERAEAVGRLLQRCPEFAGANCKVVWGSDLDRALDGADLFYLTMAVEREPSVTLSSFASMEHGYVSSDQLSIAGGFLAARAGGAIMGFARKMEQYCPEALMLIFANPVSVFSAAVSNYTKIRALGICAGFGNHRWDLSRMCGRDVYDPDWNVVATGVNHCSFILRGEYRGRDYHDVLAEYLTDDWSLMPLASTSFSEITRDVLKFMVDHYHRYGMMVFSSEMDGIAHLAWDWALALQQRTLQGQRANFDPHQCAESAVLALNRSFEAFRQVAMGTSEPDWRRSGPEANLFGVNDSDITVPILQALAGLAPMRITASHPNRGAVRGFEDNAALEYTMDLFKDTITAVPDQYIPHPYYGLIAGLSEFQTLLADAIAQQDGRLFADALDAYPMYHGMERRRPYFEKMYEIFNDIPKALARGKEFI